MSALTLTTATLRSAMAFTATAACHQPHRSGLYAASALRGGASVRLFESATEPSNPLLQQAGLPRYRYWCQRCEAGALVRAGFSGEGVRRP